MFLGCPDVVLKLQKETSLSLLKPSMLPCLPQIWWRIFSLKAFPLNRFASFGVYSWVGRARA
jgi:hypothetical protein